MKYKNNKYILLKFFNSPQIIKSQKNTKNYLCNITNRKKSNFKAYGLTRHIFKILIEKNELSGFKKAR